MHRLASQITLGLGALALFAGSASAVELTRDPRTDLFAHVPAARIQADTDRDKVFDNLEAKLAATDTGTSFSVIVRVKPGHEKAVAQVGGRVTRQLGLDHSVAAQLTKEQIRRLAASGSVESLEENGLCYATRDTANSSFGVAKASADFGLTGDRDGDPTRFSPQDLTIAVIDSGIDASHPDFAGGKIIGWKDFVNNRPQPYDDNGHGTHCASIAAGGVINGVGGVAPGASLIGLKVLSAQGSGSMDVIAQAVEFCIQNKERLGIEVVSMSLGGSTSSDGKDAVSRMVNRASEAGLVVCVAAGNSGPDAFTISTPAAAANAITVGNMIDTGKGGFALRVSSSRGPTADGRVKPDVCAPGTQILAAEANTGRYKRLSGTSMACPFAAGVAALMLQSKPSLTPSEVKGLMKETAVHFGPQGENNEYGAGRLDGYAVLAKVTGSTGTPPAVPAHIFGQGELRGEGDENLWRLPVSDARFPIGVTLILANKESDFDVFLYDPNGQQVASSEDVKRQETITFAPKMAGEYKIVVSSFEGAGAYTLDVSAGTNGK